MIEAINYLFESNLILLSGGLIYIFWLSKERNFQLRRFFVLLVVLGAVSVPYLSITPEYLGNDFKELSQNAVIQLPEIVIGGEETITSTPQTFDWSMIVVWLYAIVTGLLAFRLAIRLWSIRKVLKKGAPIVSQDVKIFDGKGKLPTFSFFNFLVISDYSMEESEREQIVFHELVHINQLHSLDVLLLELVSVVFWYNPVSWYFKKAQAENHEYIADQEVEQEYGRSSYQELLVKMTIDRMSYVGNYFSKIETLKRINMMNEKRKKANKLRLGLAGLSLVLVMSILACNDELIGTVDSAQMVLEAPPFIQEEIAQMKEANPGVDFIYLEADAPANGMAVDFESLGFDPNTVVLEAGFEDRGKIGFIVTPNQDYKKLVDYRKSKVRDGIYDVTDEYPVPPGGMEELYMHIGKNMLYPTDARENGIQGRVFVEFVVDELGNITNIRVVKGIGHGCDEEAARVLQGLNGWTPGQVDGKSVSTRMILPITFKLSEEDGSGEKKKTSQVEDSRSSDSYGWNFDPNFTSSKVVDDC